MDIQTLKSNIIDDEYYKFVHSSGLCVYVYPKKGYTSSYAVLSAKFGSINTDFEDDSGVIHKMPMGIAHYLEHKLFESVDGDAFTEFAQTGASANAFTSFDKTSYLFSCSDDFVKNLEILLSFVQQPYFTEQTVKKEQGIISQEIKMYDDNPSWRVMFNLLKALYGDHPISCDIAGSVESISKITDKMLYTCYENFYSLTNMVLVCVGNVNLDEIISILDKTVKAKKPKVVTPLLSEEKRGVEKSLIEDSMEVSIPLFEIGCKEDMNKTALDEFDLACTDVLMSMMFSESSELYRRLIDAELINSSFSYEHLEGDGFSSVLFSCEGKHPQKVFDAIINEVENTVKNGIDESRFISSKKAIYGEAVASFNNIEGIGSLITSMHFENREIYKYLSALSLLTPSDVYNRLKQQFKREGFALSVINPKEDDA